MYIHSVITLPSKLRKSECDKGKFDDVEEVAGKVVIHFKWFVLPMFVFCSDLLERRKFSYTLKADLG